jgi:hypothetical protein
MSLHPLTYFVVNQKTIFIPFRFVYPECEKLIAPHPEMYPVKCLRENGCPANMQCMDYLVKRVNYIFEKVCPSAEMMIAYYKYRDLPNSIRGAIFHKDLREPKLMTLNPFGFRKFQRESPTFQWTPTDEYKNLGAHRGIIPVEQLIHASRD